MTADFRIINHGSVWTIQAVSPEAIAFAQDHFEVEGWQGLAENFTTDHRTGYDLAKRLIVEGWRIS